MPQVLDCCPAVSNAPGALLLLLLCLLLVGSRLNSRLYNNSSNPADKYMQPISPLCCKQMLHISATHLICKDLASAIDAEHLACMMNAEHLAGGNVSKYVL
jgi:hypothetical protein